MIRIRSSMVFEKMRYHTVMCHKIVARCHSSNFEPYKRPIKMISTLWFLGHTQSTIYMFPSVWTNVMLICSLMSKDKFYGMCYNIAFQLNRLIWFECNLKYCKQKICWHFDHCIWNAVQLNNENLLLQFDDRQILN